MSSTKITATAKSHFCARVMFLLGRLVIPNWSEVGGTGIALAGNVIELVIGELAPLRSKSNLEWLPVAFQPVPIHFSFLTFMTNRRFALTHIPVTSRLEG
jgi:hypothetical protein